MCRSASRCGDASASGLVPAARSHRTSISPMATVTIERVTKRYGPDVTAVDDLSLSVEDGEFLILVGPSGCGKTTTLRCVAGLEAIDAGVVRIDERVINNVAPKDRSVAIVFQYYSLDPHMTVRRNLAVAPHNRRSAM